MDSQHRSISCLCTFENFEHFKDCKVEGLAKELHRHGRSWCQRQTYGLIRTSCHRWQLLQLDTSAVRFCSSSLVHGGEPIDFVSIPKCPS